jgi:hypothetical protein
VIRGYAIKQGSRQLRWALIEAAGHQPAGSRRRGTRGIIVTGRGQVSGVARGGLRSVIDPAATHTDLDACEQDRQDSPGNIRCWSFSFRAYGFAQ